MSKRVIKVTSDQLNNLLKELRSPLVGDHLSDDEVLDYARGELPADEKVPINHHLEACTDCRAKMEWFQKERQAWEGTSGQDRLATLRRQILGLNTATAKAAHTKVRSAKSGQPGLRELLRKLTEQLTVDFSSLGVVLGMMPQLAENHTDQPPFWQYGVTIEDALQWEVKETGKENSLLISFGSDRPELKGVRVHLEAGPWSRDLVLDELEGESESGQVRAKTELTWAERTLIPEGTFLKVELLLENPDIDS